MKVCPRCSELYTDEASYCANDGQALQTSNDRFLGRRVASRYRLIQRLGAGGMSVVYLARHELIDRMSAIKILRPELSRIAEHRERFLREARAVNRINHPNIVEITDVGESDGLAYLVMEYVQGESLLTAIQKGPMPWERGVRVAIQVAAALARAHQMGVIHRDLKPENVLLVSSGEARLGADGIPIAVAAELVKLTDFGIAKVTGEPSLTLREQLFGTPGYIAPEYVGGFDVDGRADIYSLGVVLYEMVTGVLPFDGNGQSDLLLKPLTSSPIPPSQRIDGLPPELEALLLRALSREPESRPHDAFAFHDLLVDILRRLGRASSLPLPPPSLKEGAPSLAPRDELRTIVENVEYISSLPPSMPSSAVDTPNPRMLPTDPSVRWSFALAELESMLASAPPGSPPASHAAEQVSAARAMVPRVERAAKMVRDLQTKADFLEATGRDFRANLGHAIDVLVHDRSRARAHLDDLLAAEEIARARRSADRDSIVDSAAVTPRRISFTAGAIGAGGRPDAALSDEEVRAADVVRDLTFQIETLQKQLDSKNEAHEHEIVHVTGQLEGSLSALRHLTSEIVRTIDEGIAVLRS